MEKFDQKVEKLLDSLKSRVGKNLQEDQEIESKDIPLVTSPQAVADDVEEVTEHPTADGIAVASLAPTEVTSAQRSIRNKRAPARYLAGLVPFLVLLFTVFNPPMATALILRKNKIFKEHVDVTFSESAWKIVTDLNLGLDEAAIAYLKQKILQQQKVVDKGK